MAHNLEEMMTLPAWKYLEEWMNLQEQLALNRLKDPKITDIADIQGYRGKLQAYAQLKGVITSAIERGKQELNKQMAEQAK